MNKSTQNFYARDDVLVILTTAPTGLGHTRVTGALFDGLPEIANAEVFGLADPRLQMLHRITSINPKLRQLMEFVQNNPVAEKTFTKLYRWNLRRNTKQVRVEIRDLVRKFRPKPKHVIIVSTHFSLAHQLGKIMPALRRDLDTQVSLSVIVTDDSPQLLWGVREADYIFTPSHETKQSLDGFLSGFSGKKPEIVVNPYPVSNRLAEKMNESEWKLRRKQLTPKSKELLRVMIPISGAAVQLSYFKDLIVNLEKLLPVKILLVSRDSKQTKKFLKWCSKRESVEVISYARDLEVVHAYERMYRREVVGVEVTKPSEQSFKSLYSPQMYGGSALLFSDPVGRQEDDNVDFMQRFGLLPSAEQAGELEKFLKENGKLPHSMRLKAKCWRGIMLPPESGKKAAEMIFALRESGILLSMMGYCGGSGNEVVSPDGVDGVWEKLLERLDL